MKFDSRLKKDFKERLSDFYLRTYSKDDFINPELFQLMVKASAVSGLEVCVFINRKGVIANIFVGEKDKIRVEYDKELDLYNGIRLIHTHPNSSSDLSNMDMSCLNNSMFDCVCAIGVKNGGATTAHVAYLNDDKIETIFVPNADYINKYGLMEKLNANIEKNKEKIKNGLHSTAKEIQRAILVLAQTDKNENANEALDELTSLASTVNIVTVGKLTQKILKPHPLYLIGEGKIEELESMIQLNRANVVVFDNDLSGLKLIKLEDRLGVKILTRSSIILDIFATKTKSKEGILQVELAQLKYNLPRLNSLNQSNGRFGGGVGMRGPGETKIELNKRVVEDLIIKKTKELDLVKRQRQLTRTNRLRSNKKSVAIVGYTNCGKSTLMNLLTKANVYAKDELFATLETTTRSLWLDFKKEILLIDTVGFINRLPHEFIEAFASTLEETKDANLLLHVVDISNPNYKDQIKTVNEVLKKIGAKAPIIMVYNKIDKNKDFIEPPKNGVFISAQQGKGIDDLKKEIIKYLDDKLFN